MNDQVRTLSHPLFGAVGAKLGRCYRCMYLSLSLAFGLGLLTALLAALQAPRSVLMLCALPAMAFTAWSAAHGLAYLLRGPERAAGCRSCAERARKLERRARWHHRMAWLRRRRCAGTVARHGQGCSTCGKRTPVEAMGDAPSAEAGLRHVVDRSPEFQSLLPRLVSAEPADTWTADMLHYFLYELQPDADGLSSHAVFIARWENDIPVSAVVVTSDPAGGAPRSLDLRAAPAMPANVTSK